MFSASTKAASGVVPATLDPQFNYVTMLLHGDGTNGGQNNTFLDSSTNNFSITRNGNTTQGSFSPYGSNWSNYFLSSASSYLNFGNQASLHLGSGSYTVEMWVYKNANTAYMTACGDFAAGSTNTFQILADGTGTKLGWYDGASNAFTITSVSSIPTNTWTHVAFVRNSTTLTLYINGVSDVSTTLSTNYNTSTSFFVGQTPELSAGRYWDGYISNFRVVKGTAVYTSNFTPSTTPLTAITNTSLLTCQSNSFKDNSTNNFTATVNGTPSVQRFNPFGTSTAYSTSVIGGSGYFDGSGDYLTTTMTGGLGSGDFTVEIWVYATSIYNYITWFATTRDANGFSCGTDANGALVWVNGVGGTTRKWDGATTAGNIIRVNSWNHVAFVRSSNAMRVYLNGVATVTAGSASSVSDTANYSNTNLSVGQLVAGGENPTGYLCDGRITTSALYTTTFTPPTAPLTAVSGVRLLNNYTNGAIFDNAMMNDLETVGNAQISTSVKKYGTGSLYFDGTGDGLFTVSTPNLVFGTGDFTVEFWINLAANLVSFAKIVQMGTTGDAFTIETQSTTNILTVTNFTSTVYFGSSTALTTGSWIHVAATRASGTLRLFQNGTLVGSAANTVNFTSSGTGVYIGQSSLGTGINGYIDDLRITKGYARYTANFTAPTAAFFNTGPY